MLRKISFLFLLLILLVSCKNKKTQEEVTNKEEFATHFHIHSYPKFYLLEIKEPWPGAQNFTYVLSPTPDAIPDSLKKYPLIKIPVKRLVVTSTTHLAPLEMLGQAERLIAFPNTRYISSKIFRKRIKEGKITEIGNGNGLNIEKTMALQPDMIMAFSGGTDQKKYEFFSKHHLPVLYNADWMESSPLGKAEWIKVFGVLLGANEKANRIFEKIKKNYLVIRSKVQTKKKKPLVFQGGNFGDKWFVPGGGSYAAQLIKDAGGKYVWEENRKQGSMHLNFENVLLKLNQADIWLNPGSIVSKQTLAKNIPQAVHFPSFKNDKIYTYNLSKGPNGGLIYFETAGMHPDWVLADLYHIFYPEETPDYHFHYYSVLLP